MKCLALLFSLPRFSFSNVVIFFSSVMSSCSVVIVVHWIKKNISKQNKSLYDQCKKKSSTEKKKDFFQLIFFLHNTYTNIHIFSGSSINPFHSFLSYAIYYHLKEWEIFTSRELHPVYMMKKREFLHVAYLIISFVRIWAPPPPSRLNIPHHTY